MTWNSKKVPLTHPITVGEVSYSEIEFKDPDADAMEAIEELDFKPKAKPTLRQLKGAVAAISRLPVDVIGKVHRDDFVTLCEEVVPFIEGSPQPTSAATSTEKSSTASSQT